MGKVISNKIKLKSFITLYCVSKMYFAGKTEPN